MNWTLDEGFETPGGVVRWGTLGSGDPLVLVHGTPYSSFLWRDFAPALARTRTVYFFHHLGFGQSEQHEGQDLSLAAHSRNFAQLLDHWGLSRPSVVAHDIGGAVALRTLLLEERNYRDLTLFDAVSGGEWERGLFRLFLEHEEVFRKLPDYAHEALVASHLRHATHAGFRPGILDAFLAPWRGRQGSRRSTVNTARSGRRTRPRTSTCWAVCRFRCGSSGAARTAFSLRSTPRGCTNAFRTPNCTGSMTPATSSRKTRPASCWPA
ncbi:alpha/beta fold hydrolase [Streptomyces sp. NBC_01762]|uniref:alpha/beta fold hydrolase n=1 Tax=Streptomyces sp. NBC_01762 TaxID=2975933 RepID=UPI002DDA3620|nr:alpha/beta hydrolase [Streptomyces sp. NBC_01762]